MAHKTTATLLAILPLSAALIVSLPGDAHAGRECKEGHWHQGGSGSKLYKSKAAARRAAIASWAGFTAWEYGAEWAHIKLAADRGISCKRHPGRRWSCDIDARPCRRTR